MQFPISDEAALAFSAMFYRRLAAGDGVDTAVAEGRLAVQRRLPGTLEWGTPALFLRAADGRLFEEAQAPVAPRPPAAPEPTLVTPAPEPVALPPARRAWAPAVAAVAVLAASLGVGLPLWLGRGGSVPAGSHISRVIAVSPSPRATPEPTRRGKRDGLTSQERPTVAPPVRASAAPQAPPALVADPTPNDPQRRDVGFAVVDSEAGWDAQASSVLARAWAARDADLRHVLMTAAFGSRAWFEPLFRGDPALLGRARLAQQVDSLLLAKKTTEFSSDPDLPNVVTARTTVVAHLVDARTGAIVASAEAADLGQGGLRNHADRQAFERAAETILEQLR
jgi:hypothetical protein